MSEQGNNTAMREALVLARERIVETRGYYDFDADREYFEALMATIDAAIAKPPRNCDVGSMEEQAERFTRFCLEYHSHETLCSQCPIVKNGFPLELVDKCQLAWAQMPYEKGNRQ